MPTPDNFKVDETQRGGTLSFRLWELRAIETYVADGNKPCHYCGGPEYQVYQVRRWFCIAGVKLLRLERHPDRYRCKTCERVVEFY